MKYRIVSNGFGNYKIQEKGFFFGWNDYSEEIGWGCSHYPLFNTYAEVYSKLCEVKERDAKVAAKWYTVYEEEG